MKSRVNRAESRSAAVLFDHLQNRVAIIVVPTGAFLDVNPLPSGRTMRRPSMPRQTGPGGTEDRPNGQANRFRHAEASRRVCLLVRRIRFEGKGARF